MTRSRNPYLAALCGATILTAGAAWATDATPAKVASVAPQQTTVDKDLTKLSADGAAAFQDIKLTRRAIFEGRTDDAKKFVALADTGFNKAKADDSVYTKAEGDLTPPPAKSDATKASGSAATPDATTDAQKKAPVAWAPIDGSITILEDITGNTAKTAAVGDANKSLQSGERGDAINKLKVAGIEVAVVLAVVPIDKTIDEVHQAALLIDAGKYYEGSQQLRMAESNERFDMIGNLGTPKE